MDDNTKELETLFERAVGYGKASLELVKLKTTDKTADIVSSFIPFLIVILLIATLLLFLKLGLAFWSGEVIGKTFYGFFAVTAFYLLTGIVIHFLLHKPIKRFLGNYFIKHICSKY
jgi:fatty acid desaturase